MKTNKRRVGKMSIGKKTDNVELLECEFPPKDVTIKPITIVTGINTILNNLFVNFALNNI
jgi:hypothetical protein